SALVSAAFVAVSGAFFTAGAAVRDALAGAAFLVAVALTAAFAGSATVSFPLSFAVCPAGAFGAAFLGAAAALATVVFLGTADVFTAGLLCRAVAALTSLPLSPSSVRHTSELLSR